MTDKPVIGVDEAGRGALAGPVVAAAVILSPDFPLTLLSDSKVLSAQQREQAYEALNASGSVIGIGIVNHILIDKLNILKATLLAMQRAVQALGQDDDPSGFTVIVDGNKAPTLPGYEVKTLVKGDALVPAISAASIIAKVTRDTIMKKLDCAHPQYGFLQHKGYGTQDHMEAVFKYGFSDVHRKTFNVSQQQKLF